ncbi:hypothetical protein H5V43_01705 [Sphingobium fuliginis]|jgi:hypothetical protein|uniref:Uncharacterized protein n=1 Tax=Sphingobium fuliginis (strain ATCC 27551) TaxID=336203 RepID=A0A7M2GHD1_SPHSA|nr:hypothetical protein [Sphingobium fuliginis]QOT71918.1 hypothetical protein H5V43_01705 [Sphingobium fuliginis]
MDDNEKAKAEARFMMTRRIGQARFDEQKRIGDRIEQMIYEAKSIETTEVLVALARYVFEGGKP